MHSLITIAVILHALLCQLNEATICYPCETQEAKDMCNGYDVSNCQYGFVRQQCGCCDVCGKGPGERCGGRYYMGACGEGLYCHPAPGPRQPNFPPGTCSRTPLPSRASSE